MKNKMNAIQHQKALDESVDYIMENLASWTAYTLWAKEKYQVKNFEANELWKEAWKVITEQISMDRRDRREYYQAELERIKLQAESDGDWGNSIKALQTQIKLDGMDIQQVEVKGGLEIKLNWGNKL
jgi:predicted metal-dependent peptidase